jgi:hypothetical protein
MIKTWSLDQSRFAFHVIGEATERIDRSMIILQRDENVVGTGKKH